MLTLHKNSPLITGGIIFLIVAGLHIVRLTMGTHILVGTREIPFSVSIIGAIVTGLLAFWMFAAARQK